MVSVDVVDRLSAAGFQEMQRVALLWGLLGVNKLYLPIRASSNDISGHMQAFIFLSPHG